MEDLAPGWWSTGREGSVAGLTGGAGSVTIGLNATR